MTFRSATTIAKVFERYAALIAVYKPNTAKDASTSVTKVVVRSSRGSPGGRTRTARTAINGTMPTPIASAPTAQSPYSSIRSFKNPVARYHVNDRRPIAAESDDRDPRHEHREPDPIPR